MTNACVCMCVCITTVGVVSRVAGSAAYGYVDGVITVARFFFLKGLSVDSTGNVWVTDTSNHMIRRINTAGRVHTCMHTHIYSGVCSCVSVCVGVCEVCGCAICMCM